MHARSHCTVAVTYPRGAFRGLYVGVGSGSLLAHRYPSSLPASHPGTCSKALEKGLPHSSVGAQFRALRRGIDLHSPAHLLGRILRDFFPLFLSLSLPLFLFLLLSLSFSLFPLVLLSSFFTFLSSFLYCLCGMFSQSFTGWSISPISFNKCKLSRIFSKALFTCFLLLFYSLNFLFLEIFRTKE